MIDSLTAMVDQIRNGDKTGFVEIVAKATCHDCSVAIVKDFA